MRSLLLAAAIALMPMAAQAQFYDLDGAYHCLTSGSQSCAALEAQPRAAPAAPLVKPPPPAPPSLAEAIGRVKERHPTARDIAIIEARAAAHDPRAVEVLAWCTLNGIGLKSDPVKAYFLYREADGLGVVNAKANEAAIYEGRLSSAERQQVLIEENAR